MGFPWRSIVARTTDALWPRTCPVPECGRASDRPGRHLCSRCFAALPFQEAENACIVCGRVLPAATGPFTCEECATRPPPYERIRSALRFVDPVRALVEDFKYHRATWLADDLTDLLEGVVRARLEASAVDVVIPVPLHPNRLRERGYNQSALLAEPLARRLGRRYDCTSLARIRDTPHQARLTAEERRANLIGAFAVKHPEMVRGRTVLLVDDVMTTLSTMRFCAQPLRDAGASRVWCATVARSPNNNNIT